MQAQATRTRLGSIAPFFIVRDVAPAIAFYRDLLGFEVLFSGPEDDVYFAILGRDGVSIFIKAILPEVPPLPNPSRHHWARWDAFVSVADPAALAEEFIGRGLTLHEPLRINGDRLLGFEVKDLDGYVLYFGRPAEEGE
jgi:catechol 2,3-dioxygenase-like lactoylglutathione lyase family enzyme